MTLWKQNISQLYSVLEKLSVRDTDQKELECEEGFSRWKELTIQVRSNGGVIYFIGNGASASMASHFAADIAKNGGIRTHVFTDPALITALANDLSFEKVFSEPLHWCMKEGDMLVAISSSGNSPNVVRGVERARELGGIVITLSAMDHDNRIRKSGDLNFYAAGKTYGIAETAHAAVLHYWTDAVISSK
ncbi:MAG: SIS domain-containing protein [Deltaproteobacteria bacterium]|nr:SIS domain-containing protein [Deltaproteobacteria bacterium]